MPGQRLVSREGDLWRWDGFVAAADAPTAAAQRLAEKNRLGEIEVIENAARREVEDLASAERTAAEMHSVAEGEERRLRQLWRDTQAELARVRDDADRHRASGARDGKPPCCRLRSPHSHRGWTCRRAHASRGARCRARCHDGARTGSRPSLRRPSTRPRACAPATATPRSRSPPSRASARSAPSAASPWPPSASAGARGVRAPSSRSPPCRPGSTRRRQSWRNCADLPALVDQQRQKLLTAAQEAERARQDAADRLAAADTAHREAQAALRAAQAAVTETREMRARTEARLEAARQRRAEEARRIRDNLDCAPEDCLALAAVEPDRALPALAAVESKSFCASRISPRRLMVAGLVRVGRVGFIHQPARRRQIALLKGLFGLLEFFCRERFRFRRAVRRGRQLERRARLPGRLLQPAHFVKRFGEKLVQLRRKILLRRGQQILRFLFVLMLKRDGGVGVIGRRRIGRELELGENGIDHVLLALEEIGQQDFVLDQLRRFALQLAAFPWSRASKRFRASAQSFRKNGISARLKRAFQNFGSVASAFCSAASA